MADGDVALGTPMSQAGGAAAAPRYGLWLVLVLGALAAIRLGALALSRTELFFDEAQYWFWSRELAFGYYSKPPMIAWIIRGATELCGMGEACVRAASPLIHTATAAVIYGLGSALYDRRIGFWAALVFATLPGISLSAELISTDVPLLSFWALALIALIRLRDTPSPAWVPALGAALGLGLMAKYAMVYFLLCLAVYGLWSPRGRGLWRDRRLYGALLIAALVVAPNLLWNIDHGFATLSHTADNARWSGSLFHPEKALEFIGAQFGVFGPILFAVLLWFATRQLARGAEHAEAGIRESDTVLLAFSLPVIALITLQALISRAHANWAAPAYVAAAILVTAILLRIGARRLFGVSLAIHLAVMAVMAAGGAAAGLIALPGADPYARVLGWRAIADAAAARAGTGGLAVIATDRRSLAAALSYYLRDTDLPVVAWRGTGPPRDHFELTRPLDAGTPEPVLWVGFRDEPGAVAAHFASVTPLGAEIVPAGRNASRTVYFFRLDGYRERE